MAVVTKTAFSEHITPILIPFCAGSLSISETSSKGPLKSWMVWERESPLPLRTSFSEALLCTGYHEQVAEEMGYKSKHIINIPPHLSEKLLHHNPMQNKFTLNPWTRVTLHRTALLDTWSKVFWINMRSLFNLLFWKFCGLFIALLHTLFRSAFGKWICFCMFYYRLLFLIVFYFCFPLCWHFLFLCDELLFVLISC